MRLLVSLLLSATLGSSQTITPFTLTEVSRNFDADGKLTSESRFLFAALQNGSIMSVDLDPKEPAARQIIDTARHQIILINPGFRSASEMPYNWSPPSFSGTCERRFYKILGTTVSVDKSPRSFSGVPVERVSLHSPNELSAEILMAPSLGCQMLQTTTTQNGRVVATGVSEDLRVGDPDPTLFEVPSGYRLTRVPIP